ncbi:MAG: hypothetical protein HZA78_04655 [Candidatus Schekmanbacteria bacterium]|nr:hypothetical protein [Candidatus Schekmanbacteria bacterium]
MVKLRERGLVEKNKGQSFYRVTEQGYKILWTKTAWNSYFEFPMISRAYKDDAAHFAAAPSKLESAYRQLNDALSLITKQLSLKIAA